MTKCCRGLLRWVCQVTSVAKESTRHHSHVLTVFWSRSVPTVAYSFTGRCVGHGRSVCSVVEAVVGRTTTPICQQLWFWTQATRPLPRIWLEGRPGFRNAGWLWRVHWMRPDSRKAWRFTTARWPWLWERGWVLLGYLLLLLLLLHHWLSGLFITANQTIINTYTTICDRNSV